MAITYGDHLIDSGYYDITPQQEREIEGLQTEAQRRQPMKEFCGYLSGRIYFAKRSGLRWEVWHSYQDGTADPANGAMQWKASSVRYWRRINAERAANDLWATFNDGVWCESGRMACDLMGQPL